MSEARLQVSFQLVLLEIRHLLITVNLLLDVLLQVYQCLKVGVKLEFEHLRKVKLLLIRLAFLPESIVFCWSFLYALLLAMVV